MAEKLPVVIDTKGGHARNVRSWTESAVEQTERHRAKERRRACATYF